jgi:hypothetical protein
MFGKLVEEKTSLVHDSCDGNHEPTARLETARKFCSAVGGR